MNDMFVCVKGLERLVVTGSIGGKVAEQVTKIAVERMKHPSPAIATPALQLLMSCMYTGQFLLYITILYVFIPLYCNGRLDSFIFFN